MQELFGFFRLFFPCGKTLEGQIFRVYKKKRSGDRLLLAFDTVESSGWNVDNLVDLFTLRVIEPEG